MGDFFNMDVLIRNYKRENSKYELYRDELTDISIEQLKELFKDIMNCNIPSPSSSMFYSSIQGEIRVSTKDFNYVRKGDDLYYYPNDSIISVKKKLDILDLNRFSEKYPVKKVLKLKDYFKSYFSSILRILLICLLPIYNIFVIYLNLPAVTGVQTLNLVFTLIFLSILMIVYYASIEIRFFRKKQIIELRYRLPYISRIRTADISKNLLFLGQGFYFLFFQFNNMVYFINKFLDYLIILYIIIYLALIIATGWQVYKYYLIKKDILELLLERIKNTTSFNRNFYHNLYVNAKKVRIVKAGIIAKVSSVISIFLTFVSFF